MIWTFHKMNSYQLAEWKSANLPNENLPNCRIKTAIRASDTRYFVDPSVAAAALGVGPKDLQNDLNTLGLLFETLAIRDLRVYAESMDGDVFHYRDRNGLECDAVIHLHNGNYGLMSAGGAYRMLERLKHSYREKYLQTACTIARSIGERN